MPTLESANKVCVPVGLRLIEARSDTVAYFVFGKTMQYAKFISKNSVSLGAEKFWINFRQGQQADSPR
jgi:hypothetical protein